MYPSSAFQALRHTHTHTHVYIHDAGMYPSDAFQALKCDEIMDCAEDFCECIHEYMYVCVCVSVCDEIMDCSEDFCECIHMSIYVCVCMRARVCVSAMRSWTAPRTSVSICISTCTCVCVYVCMCDGLLGVLL